MSIELICKPEFFRDRLNFQLGLNVAVEPGTTYFLCGDLSEVPELVSSSLTTVSREKKVQILICKGKTSNVSLFPVVKKNESKDCVPTGNTQTLTTVKTEKTSDTEVIKQASDRTVTLTSERYDRSREQSKPLSAGQIKVEAPVIQLPVRSVNPGFQTFIKSEVQTTFTPGVSGMQRDSVSASDDKSSSLPCKALRQELKQAILQRRMVQGKSMIDLMKEENERQSALQSIKMTSEEVDRMIKRRASNNRAARKCRQKRKTEEEQLMKEVKRLCERRNSLNGLIGTLEQQQKYLRLWATGSDANDATSKEKIKSILSTEIKIPDFSQQTEYRSEDDMSNMSNSINVSSSDNNSDDTRNGFEFDSSQDTNDSVATGYSEMVVEEISNIQTERVSKSEDDTRDSDKRNFKDIQNSAEDIKSDSDDDSDVELIEIERPLVIDVN